MLVSVIGYFISIGHESQVIILTKKINFMHP